MRIFAGLILLIAGLVVGTDIYFPDQTFQTPELIVPAVSPPRVREVALVSGPTRARRATARSVSLAATPSEAALEPASAELAAWETEVTVSPDAQRRMTSSKPGDSWTRYELVRDLQRELKRVGCYWGRVDGSWGSGSKRAMGEFTERVNAALPASEPDYILLSLVQNHPGRVCGNACPSGQSADNHGRCLPNAMLAQSDSKQSDSRSRRLERMAAAAHKATPDALDGMTARTSRTATTVAADSRRNASRTASVARANSRAVASPEVLPWQRATSAQVASSDPIAGRVVNELPGRMSIGGPIPPRPSAAPITAPSATQPVMGTGKRETRDRLATLEAGDASGSVGEVIPPPKRVVKQKRRSRSAQAPSHRRRKVAKGSFWKPRPGTARYNLMVSLGGAY